MTSNATLNEPGFGKQHPPDTLRRVVAVWYYFGFALSGIACVLPGVLMPAMIAAWRLSDRHAGLVLLCVNAGSAAGALLARGTLHGRIVSGGVLLALAAVTWPIQSHVPGAIGLLWGIGVGLLMTSISLVRQRVPGSAATELVRLNFVWALGAFVCAPLMAHALRFSRLSGALDATALVLVIFSGGMLLLPILPEAAHKAGNADTQTGTQRRVPVALVLCTVLAPGIEAACGGWLSTYAERYHGSLFTIIAAPTCLWMGLLLGRACAWLPRAEARLHRLTPAFVLLVALAAAGLLTLFSPGALLLFAFLMGFGLGPLYPLFLSRALSIRESGTIFFFAGVAASVLPYITGLLSSTTGSLRVGFLTITASAAALALLFFSKWREPWPL